MLYEIECDRKERCAITPVTSEWIDVEMPDHGQLPMTGHAEGGRSWVVDADHPSLRDDRQLAHIAHTALRADSEGAPDTIWQAWKRGGPCSTRSDSRIKTAWSAATWTAIVRPSGTSTGR